MEKQKKNNYLFLKLFIILLTVLLGLFNHYYIEEGNALITFFMGWIAGSILFSFMDC